LLQPTAFINQLINLANNALTSTEKDVLSLIIGKLFSDLDIGHSCSILQDIPNLSIEEQFNLLLKSKLAAEYSSFPINLEALPISILNFGNKQLVYITKYLQYELDIVNKIELLTNTQPQQVNSEQGITTLKHLSAKIHLPNNEQLQAISNCLKQKFSIITGGPGTGKTTTVAILLWLLYQNYGDKLKIKICAPTGKASKRVKESIRGSILNPRLNELDFSQVLLLLESSNNFLTIHKLLGFLSNSIYFKYNKNNLLDVDVLIIDESSMISLPLFSKLLEAIDANRVRHVILLGDKNQLSSVEEGYVFAALVNAPKINRYITSLIVSNRSNQDISNLANAVQAENLAEVNKLLSYKYMPVEQMIKNVRNFTSNNTLYPNIKIYAAKLSYLFDKQLFAKGDNSLNRYFKFILHFDLTNITELFAEFNRQAVLCLTNIGQFGTINLNAQIEKKVKYMLANNLLELEYDLFAKENEVQQFDLNNEWYTGRPIIILDNDYTLELFNGDIGICIIHDGKPQVVFENGRRFVPEILPKYQVAYAITIHKSQGSEYEHVNLVLCGNSGIESMGRILTKELVYTGITRAKTSISFFTGDKVLAYAISNKTKRNTGLDLTL
jgi:exodeoxyribonuclease V alpha subunit